MRSERLGQYALVLGRMLQPERACPEQREGATVALVNPNAIDHQVAFVNQLTKLAKGVALYTSNSDLATGIIESYLSERKKKTYVA